MEVLFRHCILGGILLSMLSFDGTALAQESTSTSNDDSPPNLGGPVNGDPPSDSNTVPSGSRDDCPLTSFPIMALVAPTDSNMLNYSTDSTPTVWVYMPYTINSGDPIGETIDLQLGNSARFEIDDKNGNEIKGYETVLSGHLVEPGIISLTLPETVPELEIGEEYRWTMLLYCGDRHYTGRPLTVSGWITRIEPGSIPEENIWYDRLTEFGTAFRNDPTNPALANQWGDLMQHVDEEIDSLANQPIQDCCTLERSQYP